MSQDCQAGQISILLSFLVISLAEVQPGPVLMPIALWSLLAPPSHGLSLPLLDSPQSIPTPSQGVGSASSTGRKGSTSHTILWCPDHTHLHPHPQQPFSLTHALELFLNDILLPGCGGKKTKRNTLPRIQAEYGVIAKF